ncbi:MAG: VTT domain-containing protein, partial [Haloferacaceae archaeon]
AALLFQGWLADLADPAVLTALVRDAGPAAPAVFLLVQVVQVLVAPIPSPAVALIGGYLFGPVVGSLLSVAGVAVGSALAFWLARRFGRAVVERFVPAGAIARFDALTARRGAVGLFLAK